MTLAPLRGAVTVKLNLPVVSATLRPPATFSEPFGFNLLVSNE